MKKRGKMVTKIVAALVASIAYVGDPDVRTTLGKFLEQLDEDIEDAGLEHSTELDECMTELMGTIDMADEARAADREAFREAMLVAREEAEDEDEGDVEG